MMDYYSNYPAPSREEAIKEVIKATNAEEEIVKSVIMGMPSLGSYTGWYVGFKQDAIKEVNKLKEERKETNNILQKITGDPSFKY
jgi:hypothetical protein